MKRSINAKLFAIVLGSTIMLLRASVRVLAYDGNFEEQQKCIDSLGAQTIDVNEICITLSSIETEHLEIKDYDTNTFDLNREVDQIKSDLPSEHNRMDPLGPIGGLIAPRGGLNIVPLPSYFIKYNTSAGLDEVQQHLAQYPGEIGSEYSKHLSDILNKMSQDGLLNQVIARTASVDSDEGTSCGTQSYLYRIFTTSTNGSGHEIDLSMNMGADGCDSE